MSSFVSPTSGLFMAYEAAWKRSLRLLLCPGCPLSVCTDQLVDLLMKVAAEFPDTRQTVSQPADRSRMSCNFKDDRFYRREASSLSPCTGRLLSSFS